MNILLHMIYESEEPVIYIVDLNKIQEQEVLDLINEAEDDEHYGLQIIDHDEVITKYFYMSDLSTICVDVQCHIEKIITVWDR